MCSTCTPTTREGVAHALAPLPEVNRAVLEAVVGLLAAACGKAVQVEHIRLTLVLKAHGFQPVESTSPFKVLVSDVFNLHPYSVSGSAVVPVTVGDCVLGEYYDYVCKPCSVGRCKLLGGLKAPPQVQRLKPLQTAPYQDPGFKRWFQLGACTPTARPGRTSCRRARPRWRRTTRRRRTRRRQQGGAG